jgi:hypothetical protein
MKYKYQSVCEECNYKGRWTHLAIKSLFEDFIHTLIKHHTIHIGYRWV